MKANSFLALPKDVHLTPIFNVQYAQSYAYYELKQNNQWIDKCNEMEKTAALIICWKGNLKR